MFFLTLKVRIIMINKKTQINTKSVKCKSKHGVRVPNSNLARGDDDLKFKIKKKKVRDLKIDRDFFFQIVYNPL